MRIEHLSIKLIVPALIVAVAAAAPVRSAAPEPTPNADGNSSSAVAMVIATLPGTAGMPTGRATDAVSSPTDAIDRTWLEIFDRDALERWWQRYQDALERAE